MLCLWPAALPPAEPMNRWNMHSGVMFVRIDIPHDKLLHFTMGVLLALVFGLPVALVVGVAKEVIWDWKLKRGTPEVLDIVATALGAIIVYLLA